MKKSSHGLTAQSIFDDLRGWMDDWAVVNRIKDRYTDRSIARQYHNYLNLYKIHREKIHFLILIDKELYKDVKALASQSLLFDILIDGWSYDINKTEMGKDPVLPFLPFPMQLPLIEALDGNKHIHVGKSRRQGASAVMGHSMCKDLKHGFKLNVVTTHKDAASLDGGDSDLGKDSIVERVRWLLDKSIFIPNDWRNRKKYWHKEDKTKQKYFTKDKQIVINGNRLTGSIMGKGTNVGFSSHKIYTDEIDVVCDLYPNLAEQIFGSFSSSVNQMILYSTYRSKDYPFYRYKKKNDQKHWAFVELHWKDNPTCNAMWYANQCSKLFDDKVLIARELDMDPTQSREGVIWPTLTELNLIPKREVFKGRGNWVKVIGADFGGGTSATVFLFAWFNMDTSELFIEDMLKTTVMEGEEIADYFKAVGFFGIDVEGDVSGTFQTTTPRYSWTNILNANGITLNPVGNTDMFYTQAGIRKAFKDFKILLNKDNPEIYDDLSSASYKNDRVLKDDHSHSADALSYLFRSIFETSSITQVDVRRNKW